MRAVSALIALLLVAPFAAAEDKAIAPLPAEAQAAFADIRQDPPPPEIVRNSHYWISNEYRHDLFRDTITGVGGVLIGVGTDQNYLMAGWARPEILVLMDFDAAIPRIHRAYKMAFEESANPADFLAFWEDDNAAAVLQRLEATYGGDDVHDGKRTLQAFKVAQPLIKRRLKKTIRDYGKRGVTTFLDDAEQYRWVRDLWRAGRVFAVRGDLTASQTMLDIGAAAKKAGVPVRVVYMSNAPQYFDFDDQFRANIAALPMDESRGSCTRSRGVPSATPMATTTTTCSPG
ncbi:MAG: hypothetical protein R3F43_14475 [bacterium]